MFFIQDKLWNVVWTPLSVISTSSSHEVFYLKCFIKFLVDEPGDEVCWCFAKIFHISPRKTLISHNIYVTKYRGSRKNSWKPHITQPLLNSNFSEYITIKISSYLVLGFIKKLLKQKFDNFQARSQIWKLIATDKTTSFICRGRVRGDNRNIPLGKGIYTVRLFHAPC